MIYFIHAILFKFLNFTVKKNILLNSEDIICIRADISVIKASNASL
jgi:hypothetical protein